MKDNEELIPLNYKVLIKDEIIESKSGGGIWLNPETVEQEQTGSMFGEIVAVGPAAFQPDEVTYDKGNKLATRDNYKGLSPQVGDRVAYVRHAGVRYIKIGGKFRPINEQHSDDSECYRLMNDIDIQAIITEGDV